MINGSSSFLCPVCVTVHRPVELFLGGLHQKFILGGVNKFSRGQRAQRKGMWDGSLLVRASTRFANELNPYSDYVVMDAYSMELGIWLSFVKTSEFLVV
jgi:hypothetical protein